MKLFLDSSVLLAACGSVTGACREIFNRAKPNGWTLVATPYVVEEVVRHLGALSPTAATEWEMLRSSLQFVEDIFTLDRPAVFSVSKDRPIPFSALAWADVLLTLDQVHFEELMRVPFYGLIIQRPGKFLETQREINQLR